MRDTGIDLGLFPTFVRMRDLWPDLMRYAWAKSTIMSIKAEKVLAELNRLRTDLEKDPQDMEWFALHHAFCFISYKMGEFQKYLNETVKQGEHPED